MTDHNARQAGQMLTIDEIDTIKQHAYRDGFKDAQRMLAAHSADARNGEGVPKPIKCVGCGETKNLDLPWKHSSAATCKECGCVWIPFACGQGEQYAATLAAPTAPARNGEGVALTDALRECVRVLESAKLLCNWPKMSEAITNAISQGRTALLAAPAAPASEPTRVEQLRKALFEARDAMRVMANWVKKSDPAGHSWGVRMVDRANDVLGGATPPAAATRESGAGVPTECQTVFGEPCQYARDIASGRVHCIHCDRDKPTSAQQDEREAFSISEDDFEIIDAAARKSFKRNQSSVRGQQVSRADDWDSHVIWATAELLRTRAAQQVQAGGEDKRWRWRYVLLRVLFPSAPSEQELDAAIDAALSREQPQPSNGDREGGAV